MLSWFRWHADVVIRIRRFRQIKDDMHFSAVYYENIDPRENYTCGVTSKMTFVTQLAFRNSNVLEKVY